MTNILLILCFVCIILKTGSALSSEDNKTSKATENYSNVAKDKAEDLEGAETVGKLFNLKGIFPSYGTYPSYGSGRYPSTGGGYYPSSSGGYYPSSSGGYYPSSSGGYYPSSGGDYYPSYNKPSNGFYPSSGYYPSASGGGVGVGGGSSGFYPSTGTNILGHGAGAYPSQSYYPSTNPWYRTTSDHATTLSSSHGGYGGYGARSTFV
ncbi:protein suex-1 isoform X2 [Eupeodes corollae]|uniref:protein suex-1 isoform X2 n=1 Tax=Eupeodes corollae TaxID=290404 RepID=UPI00248F9A6E|nr:protein suex-1 isoform X2 [Eupeodes corollae]